MCTPTSHSPFDLRAASWGILLLTAGRLRQFPADFALGLICSIIFRIAAVEPGALRSLQASKRRQHSSRFENMVGF